MTLPTRSTPTRLGAFAVLLVVAFAAAFGVGRLVDPTDGPPSSASHGAAGPHGGASTPARATGHGAAPATTHGAGHGEASAPADANDHESGAEPQHAHGASPEASGLSAAQDGLRLVPEATRLRAGRTTTFRFRIEDADGAPVRSGYELESERELHLIVVRRDGRGFRHVHPRRAADGTWSVPLAPAVGGRHRVLADFVVGGVRRVLGVDVEVAGDDRLAPPAAPTRTASVDGLRIALDGTPRAGHETTLRFRVTTPAGRPVPTLQPYLGARGHLVALREGDLAYLHLHPADDHGAAPADGEVAFAATFPTAGRYLLYLQVRVAGVVRTAPFVLEVAR